MKRGPRSIAADNGHLNICRHDVMQVTGMSLEEQERTNFHKGGLSHYLHRSVSFKLGEFVLYSSPPFVQFWGFPGQKHTRVKCCMLMYTPEAVIPFGH